MKAVQFVALILPLLAMPAPILAQPPQIISAELNSTESATSRVFTYQCVDNNSFAARYRPQSVELMLEGMLMITLSQIPSASGAFYSDVETTLFTKGNAAFLERNGTTVYANCLAETAVNETSQRSLTIPARIETAEPVRGMW